MEKTFEKNTFGKRLKTMLHVDFRRMFTMPLIYIVLGICLVSPILIFVMTTMMDGSVTTDPQTGEETITESKFDHAWQIIGSISNPKEEPSDEGEKESTEGENPMGGGMDITSMVNINMLYFAVAIIVCLFVGADFRSGYSKNLFTVRASKVDYVISKTLVGVVGGALMIVCFFIGSVIGATIMSIPFDLSVVGSSTISVGSIVFCLLAKVLLVGVFVPIYVLASVIAKQRVWLSILISCGISMLLFMMIPMITPLDGTFINPVLCLGASILASLGIGAISNTVLNKTALV
ncbi:MAG: hypothetical protein J6A96_01820 [Clostridia bacterium]|nr:hypothetical protein [Clostridia bacterium]